MARRYDSELVTRLQQGDEQAFTALIAQHHAALRRTALAFVSTGASADEVVQDTWVAVLDGLASFEGRSTIKTWIYQILINRARTRGVREARSIPVSAITSESPTATDTETRHLARRDHSGDRIDDAGSPTELLLRKELAHALDVAMRDLPERWRTVVMLRDALGWTPEDVCSALSVNETNQRVLLHRARGRLRARLEHYRAATSG
jgi:RNA polymerase sigma-70 factor (ECF subfamily)